jgi:hypothetical protein
MMMMTSLLRVFLAACLLPTGVAAGVQQAAKPNQPKRNPRESASQFYLRYRSAVQNASTVDEVTRFWQKSLVAEFKQAPPDQRADLAGFKRMYNMLSDVSVVSESIGTDATGVSIATLKLRGTTADGVTMSGTASLVQEGGGWKLAAPEDWP